jgi:hypothetical protein
MEEIFIGDILNKNILTLFGNYCTYEDLKFYAIDKNEYSNVHLSYDKTKSNLYNLFLTLIIDNIMIKENILILRNDLREIMSKLSFYTMNEREENKNNLIEQENQTYLNMTKISV